LPGVSLSSINLFSSGASGPIFVVPFLSIFLAPPCLVVSLAPDSFYMF
jgi:hypothetical protein